MKSCVKKVSTRKCRITECCHTDIIYCIARKSEIVNECVLFGRYTSASYPTISIGGVSKTVAKAVYEYIHGTVKRGLYICHTCDVPSCWNPNHLYAGTASDNAKDCVERNRRRKPWNINIKERLYDKIVDLYSKERMSGKEIALELNISDMVVYNTLKKRNVPRIFHRPGPKKRRTRVVG